MSRQQIKALCSLTFGDGQIIYRFNTICSVDIGRPYEPEFCINSGQRPTHWCEEAVRDGYCNEKKGSSIDGTLCESVNDE